MNLDIVPINERLADARRALRIVGLEIRQRLVGQHHPPAERIVWPVAFDHHDLMRGIPSLQRDREVETTGTAAQTNRAHKGSLRRKVQLNYYNLRIFKLKAFDQNLQAPPLREGEACLAARYRAVIAPLLRLAILGVAVCIIREDLLDDLRLVLAVGALGDLREVEILDRI